MNAIRIIRQYMVKMIIDGGIKTAVFPVAGRGTRLMPFTSYMAKELMPVYDKPLIHYGIQEALACGINHFIMVIAKGKEAIIDYCLSSASGNLLQESQITLAYQHEQNGLGHAVLMAKSAMLARGEAGFLVIAPDDVMVAKSGEYPAIHQLITQFNQEKALYSLVEKVPLDKTKSYGILGLDELYDQNNTMVKAKFLVEKPQNNPPSPFGIIARYCLPIEIFAAIEAIGQGALGEIQLTDAMGHLINKYNFYGVISRDQRFDCGNPNGLFLASQYFYNQVNG